MNPNSNPGPTRRSSAEGQNQAQGASYDLAAQWLEQQQQQQRHLLERQRLALNQAILGSPPTTTRQLPQQGLLNQRVGGILPSDSDLQRAYLFDAQRRQQVPQGSRDFGTSNNSTLQHNLNHFLAASTAQVSAGAGGGQLGRLMAAESLLMQRRSKMEEAARLIQLRGAMQGAYYRGDTSAGSAGLSIPTGPILPLQFLATNSAPQHNPRTLPAMFHHGHDTGVLPFSRPLIASFESQLRSGESQQHAKRKAEEHDMDHGKEPAKKNALPLVGNCFPLPSRKRARKITMKLTSYQALWDELEESEMQEEIFRHRIFEGIKMQGESRSVKRLPS